MDGLIAFARTMSAGTDRVAAFLSAVSEIDLANRREFYWAGRLTLCSSPDDLARYDALFADRFDAPTRPGQPRRAAVAAVPATLSEEEGPDAAVQAVGASEADVLRHRDVSTVDSSTVNALLEGLRVTPPLRRSSRRHRARHGVIDPRRTTRAMLASGGEPLRLYRRRRKERPRRTVLLIDVSGSMEPYADALLRFAHVVSRRIHGVEVFTLGTRLTRVTRQLRTPDADAALTAAARAVPDFAGGTRLGETLQAFLDRWGRRGVARGAAVVVFSDGWERRDPSLLATQAARLQRLAHTVRWLNPHAGSASYQPIQAGIVAVLPYLDGLLAGHSVAAWQQLLDGLGGDHA